MTVTEQILELIRPNPHLPTAQYIEHLWYSYAEPESWDWDEMIDLMGAAPIYTADVRFDGNSYQFLQVGGGQAVKEFFTEDGRYSRHCVECDAIETIVHRKSPWCCVVLGNGMVHDPGCTHYKRDIDTDQLQVGLAWLVIGTVHQMMREEPSGTTESGLHDG